MNNTKNTNNTKSVNNQLNKENMENNNNNLKTSTAMKLTFTFPEIQETIDRNALACDKLQKVMEEGARLVLKPYTNKLGYPFFWVEAVYPKKTETFSVPAYQEITQKTFDYLQSGLTQKVTFDKEKFSNSKITSDFSFDLFKAVVNGGLRINMTSAFQGARSLNAYTNHKKGQLTFSLKMDTELELFLEEKQLA